MPNVNEGTSGPDTGATAPAEEQPLDLEGFSEAMVGGHAPTEPAGEPEGTKAVEASDQKEAPQGEAEKEATPAKSEEKAPTASTVNFDGFSDAQKTTWKRLLESGHVTPEEVERARIESMFQSAFTKKTMALADQRKAWEKQQSDLKTDLEILQKIRSDDRLHAAFLRAAKEEIRVEGEDSSDLVDAKKAEEIADRRYAAREAERDARTAKEQKFYDDKMATIKAAVHETMDTLKIDQATMKSYLEAEESTLPDGVDPIVHFSAEEIQYRVALRHDAAVAKAEAAKLREQLHQKTSQDARTSKQSLPPARRVAQGGAQSPLQQTETDLGLDQDWSQVQGFGFRK